LKQPQTPVPHVGVTSPPDTVIVCEGQREGSTRWGTSTTGSAQSCGPLSP